MMMHLMILFTDLYKITRMIYRNELWAEEVDRGFVMSEIAKRNLF